MLRLPNPGSDISGFIRIFQVLYEELWELGEFSLDDMSRALVERNLATSCGYMGNQALARSTRRDRSRDPLYNQSKSYSELFRLLGWIHPTVESRLQFTFTYFGAHVASAQRDTKAIFKETVLGIAYPNEVVDVKTVCSLRPFACILRAMLGLNGKMCRDEIILGPLSLSNDRDDREFNAMISDIRKLRGRYEDLDRALDQASSIRGITRTTMGNYTRFPLAVLLWTGWAKKIRSKKEYQKSLVFLELTTQGRKQAESVCQQHDVRESDLNSLPNDEYASFARVVFYQMLERAGFDLKPIRSQLTIDINQLKSGSKESKLLEKRECLFSPFQESDPAKLIAMFPNPAVSRKTELQNHEMGVITTTAHGQHSTITTPVLLREQEGAGSSADDGDVKLQSEIRCLYKSNGKDVDKTVSALREKYESSNQDVYYPLIAGMFRCLGYDCEHSRAGVNYQRWDAFIEDEVNSVPIEIKSPGEELHLSVKAIRQSLENKVILLSRKPYPTTLQATTLAVGHYLPNDRSEVAALIDDIKSTYQITVGVIDFSSLTQLVVARLCQKKLHDKSALTRLFGFVKIANA